MNRKSLIKAALGLLLAGLTIGAIATLVRSLSGETRAPARQVARIAVLPDTPPPPPPPPPKQDKPDEPKPQQRPQAQPQAADTPPADAPLKMEGAAGDGPSAFAAGAVTQDYQGGAPNIGGGASAPAVADRAAERLYASTVRQLLRDEIERHLAADAGELTASFAVWVAADGRIQRVELEPGTEAAQEAPMRQALDDSARALRLPPPPTSAPALRFRLTVRGAG